MNFTDTLFPKHLGQFFIQELYLKGYSFFSLVALKFRSSTTALWSLWQDKRKAICAVVKMELSRNNYPPRNRGKSLAYKTVFKRPCERRFDLLARNQGTKSPWKSHYLFSVTMQGWVPVQTPDQCTLDSRTFQYPAVVLMGKKEWWNKLGISVSAPPQLKT